MDGKIGMFVNSIEGYQGTVIHEVEQAAAREGLVVEVFDCEYSAVKQAQEVMRFQYANSDRRLCVFVIPEADAIQVGAAEADPTYRLALRMAQKDVGWITLNHGRQEFVSSLRARFPTLPIALVAIDNVNFGRVQGRQVRTMLPRGGDVLYLRGNPFDTACVERSAGMNAELEGSGIRRVEIDARWGLEEAQKLLHKWLTSPIHKHAPLDLVVAQNDHMARGARLALQAVADEVGRAELKTLPVLGGDGLPGIGRPWVDDGTLTATVCVELPGRAAVEQLARFWRDGAPVPAVTRLPVTPYPALQALRPVAH